MDQQSFDDCENIYMFDKQLIGQFNMQFEDRAYEDVQEKEEILMNNILDDKSVKKQTQMDRIVDQGQP